MAAQKKASPRQGNRGRLHARLAQAVKERREELGMTQQDLSNRSGVSVPTIRAVERERSGELSTRVIRALETALGWQHGSIAAIAIGEDPTLADDNVSVLRRGPVTITELTDIHETVATLEKLLEQRMEEMKAQQAAAAHVDPEVFRAAQRLAATEGRTVSDVLSDALNLYRDVMTGGD